MRICECYSINNVQSMHAFVKCLHSLNDQSCKASRYSSNSKFRALFITLLFQMQRRETKAKAKIDLDTFHLMRYGTREPKQSHSPKFDLKTIARFYEVPYSNVVALHRSSKLFMKGFYFQKQSRTSRFSVQHLNYLTS